MSDLFKWGIYTLLTCMMQVERVCTCLWYSYVRFLHNEVISYTWITLNGNIGAWVTDSSEVYTSFSLVSCRWSVGAHVCDIHMRGICMMSSLPASESLWMIPSAHERIIKATNIHHPHLHDAHSIRVHLFVIFICEVFAWWAHFHYLNHFECQFWRMSDLFKWGICTLLACMMQVERVCACLWYS
jgi:hypothetical protein